MLNRTRILEVAADIEANPEGFDMRNLDFCIVGRAGAMHTTELAEQFGLTTRQAIELCIPTDLGRQHTATAAVATLRRLAETGEVRWNV